MASYKGRYDRNMIRNADTRIAVLLKSLTKRKVITKSVIEIIRRYAVDTYNAEKVTSPGFSVYKYITGYIESSIG